MVLYYGATPTVNQVYLQGDDANAGNPCRSVKTLNRAYKIIAAQPTKVGITSSQSRPNFAESPNRIWMAVKTEFLPLRRPCVWGDTVRGFFSSLQRTKSPYCVLTLSETVHLSDGAGCKQAPDNIGRTFMAWTQLSTQLVELQEDHTVTTWLLCSTQVMCNQWWTRTW